MTDEYGPVQSRPTNTLGLAGFIVSLAGFFTGGLLCPVGLVLSLFALWKRPRGFAIAGVVLGALGTLGAIIAVLVVGVFGVLTCCFGCCGSLMSPYVVTKVHIHATAAEVRSFEKHQGRLPATLEESSSSHRRSTRDGWNHPLHLRLEPDGGFTIVSDGPDGIEGTGDDLSETFSPRSQ
ncbi:MAG: DUF4190 domain-containing protein [Phycisphaerales bacterium]